MGAFSNTVDSEGKEVECNTDAVQGIVFMNVALFYYIMTF